jgi:hypothetical protein
MPAYPLALVALELEVRPSYRNPITARTTITALRTREAGGRASDVTPPASPWVVDVGTRESLDQTPKILSTSRREKDFFSLALSTGSWVSFSQRGTVTFTATPGENAPPRAVAALVNDAFRTQTGVGVGGSLPLGAGESPALSVVGAVHGFPTLPADSAGAVVDLATFAAVSYVSDGTVFEPSEWWLDTDGSAAPVAERLEEQPYLSEDVVDAKAHADALTNDPVAVGISGALLLGFAAAAVFAVVGFAVSAAVSAAERTTEFAVLRAIGVSSGQLSRSLALEGGLVVLLAVAAGTALGAGLAWLVLPYVSLTGEGGRPFPDVRVVFPWRTAAWLELAVIVVLAAVVAVEIHVLRRMSLAPALRAGEDR